jgi:hypothetical protein
MGWYASSTAEVAEQNGFPAESRCEGAKCLINVAAVLVQIPFSHLLWIPLS